MTTHFRTHLSAVSCATMKAARSSREGRDLVASSQKKRDRCRPVCPVAPMTSTFMRFPFHVPGNERRHRGRVHFFTMHLLEERPVLNVGPVCGAFVGCSSATRCHRRCGAFWRVSGL